MGERYICRIRTGHFTLDLTSKYAGGPQQAHTGIRHCDGHEVTIPAGVKHVNSNRSGILSLVISSAARFAGLPLEACTHYRTIRDWRRS
jgi:hypothetical protein